MAVFGAKGFETGWVPVFVIKGEVGWACGCGWICGWANILVVVGLLKGDTVLVGVLVINGEGLTETIRIIIIMIVLWLLLEKKWYSSEKWIYDDYYYYDFSLVNANTICHKRWFHSASGSKRTSGWINIGCKWRN